MPTTTQSVAWEVGQGRSPDWCRLPLMYDWKICVQVQFDADGALGDMLPIELKATLKKVENVSLTLNQCSDIHVSLHIDSLIKELSILGHVMDSPPCPSQSTWSSESVAKAKGLYCIKVQSMTSTGKRNPYGGLQVKAKLRPKLPDGAVFPERWRTMGMVPTPSPSPSDCWSSPVSHHNG